MIRHHARLLRTVLCGLILTLPSNGRNTARGAGVQLFPQGEATSPDQVRLTFSEDVVVPAEKSLEDAARISCGAPEPKGNGVWLDGRTWAYTFLAPLEGGRRCNVKLSAALAAKVIPKIKDATLSFTSGGPSVQSTHPYERGTLEEDQILAVVTSAPLDPSSVAGRASLRIEGIASPVGLAAFVPPAATLKALFRSEYGLEDAFAAQRVVFLRPATTLPAGKRATLVWNEGIRSPQGVATSKPQEIEFSVRPPFSLDLSCPRENAKAGCLPIAPIELSFSSDVPWDVARDLRLERVDAPSGGGKEAPHTPARWDEGEAAPFALVRNVRFRGPFTPRARYRLKLPARFLDASGRALEALPESSFTARVGEVPVLAKFSGPFGLVERADPVVALHLRRVRKDVKLRGVRVTPDDTAKDPALPFRWHKRVLRAINSPGEESQSDAKGPDGKREKSLFRKADGVPTRLVIPSLQSAAEKKSTDARPSERPPDRPGDVEVVGVPLAGSGLHVLELESETLGRALLPEKLKGPMHVASSALVTDLALSIKLGRTTALAWVTHLSTGKPEAGARVFAVGCDGKIVGEARTDANGIARIPRAKVTKDRTCYDEKSLFWEGLGLVALSQDGTDMTFALSSWDNGIERWRFHGEDEGNGNFSEPEDIPAGGDESSPRSFQAERDVPYALVLDRTLLRAGETLHVAVSAWATRKGPLPQARLPRFLELRHFGSDEANTYPLAWSAGTAELTIPLADSLRKGTYGVSLKDTSKGDSGRTLATVRIEDFKVPSVRLRPGLPAPGVIPVDLAAQATLQVDYLSGGVPAGSPASARVEVKPLENLRLEAHPGFVFSSRPIAPGLHRDTETEAEQQIKQPHPSVAATLSKNGEARFPFNYAVAHGLFQQVEFEASFDDAVGERQTTAATARQSPASSVVGIQERARGLAPGNVSLQSVVIDASGSPVKNAQVAIAVARRKTYSVRKKILGGFYGYESTEDISAREPVCETKTDAKGRAQCDWLARPGEFLVEATHVSREGTRTHAVTLAMVRGDATAVKVGGESDRLTLMPNKRSFEPGETAHIQIAAPFSNAMALVTVEAGDVLDAKVVPFSAAAARFDLPISPDHAPNIVFSALLVRGRVGEDRAIAPGEVDLGRPTFRLGMTTLRVTRRAQTLVVKAVSDKSTYRVREKGSVRVKVSGPDGELPPADTRVTLFAVDEALLALSKNDTTDALAQFLPYREHEVGTATNASFVIGRRHFGLKARDVGGGGGRLPTRELFDTLLVWKPHVRLNAQGEADVPFAVNDSLTQWRVFAVASSSLSRRAGTGETTFDAKQDVLVIPRVPLAVRSGDEFGASFLVRNTSQESRSLRAAFKVNGEAVDVTPDQVTLDPGAETVLTARVKQKSDGTTGNLALTFRLTGDGGGDADALSLKIPVTAPFRPRTLEASADPLGENGAAKRHWKFDGGRPHTRTLTLSLERASVGDADRLRAYLSTYPYSCTEQLFARAVVEESRKGWDAFVRELATRTDDSGLSRYFPGDGKGDEWLTAYVLVGAHAWGKALPKELVARMTSALRPVVGRALEGRVSVAPFSTRVLALEALVRHGAHINAADLEIPYDAQRTSWQDFASLLSTAHAGAPRYPRLAALETELRQALPSRLVRAGAGLDLKEEAGLEGAQAQYVRARLLETLFAKTHTGVANAVPENTLKEGKALGLSLVRAHALASGSVKNPGTLWSVWGLLAEKRVREFLPDTKSSLRWSVTGPGVTDAGASVNLDASKPKFSHVLTFPGAATDAELSVRAKGAADNVFVYTHLSTTAPVGTPEHRGLSSECTWARTRAKPGETVTVSYLLRSQAPRDWTLLEIPMPPGSQILAHRTGTGPSFTEQSALAARLWYRDIGSEPARGEMDVLLNIPVTTNLPGCHAEVMQEPDVSSQLPPVMFEVSQ